MTGKVVSDLATFDNDLATSSPDGITATMQMTTESSILVNETRDGVYSPTEVSTIVCFGVGVWMVSSV